MGSRSESRQETEGSTEKVVFEMRIAIWLGLWHLEGLTQGYSKQRGQNLQRCKTDSGASSFLLVQCHQRIKTKGAWPELSLLGKEKMVWSACLHSSHRTLFLTALILFSMGELLDMSGSILCCRRITLNGLNLGRQDKRKIRAPKTV